jgi:peptidoglycan/LPS O-acetylase OafA/YrhL
MHWIAGWTVGTAVPIFLIISGFLVSKSWSGSPQFLPFVKKRLLRIFPALICTTVFCIFIVGPLVTSLPLSQYFSHPLTFSYMHNIFLFPIQYILPGVFETNPFQLAVNGSIWTLPIEVFLYAVMTVLGVARILLKRYVISVIIFSLVCIEALYGDRLSSQPMLFNTMPITSLLNFSIFFFIGCLYYLMRSKIRLNNYFTVIAFTLLLFSSKLSYGANIASYILLPYIVIQFAYMDFPAAQLFQKNDLSYGLYIYAFPIQQTAIYFFKDMLPMYGLFPLAFCALLLCSYLSWKLVEYPALRLKY